MIVVLELLTHRRKMIGWSLIRNLPLDLLPVLYDIPSTGAESSDTSVNKRSLCGTFRYIVPLIKLIHTF